jgi:hypothetical protein
MKTDCFSTLGIVAVAMLGIVDSQMSHAWAWTPPAASQLWFPSGAPGGAFLWSSVACSSDGNKLVAVDSGSEVGGGGIWVSSDGGGSWEQTSAPSNSWMGVASSSDGTKLVAVALMAGIYVSADSGATWTQTSAVDTSWSAVACSADGAVLIATTILPPESIYWCGMAVSIDSGKTWQYPIGATNAQEFGSFWPSVACSADGSKLFAVQLDSADLGQVILSTDHGASWNAITEMDQFCSVACSADGTKLAATCNQNSVYTSSDGGTIWTEFEPTLTPGFQVAWNVYWQYYNGGIASSSDGEVLLAGGNGGVYASTNAGADWQQANGTIQPGAYISGQDYSFALSADGSKWVTTCYDGGGSGYPGEGNQGIWLVTNALASTKIIVLSGNLAFGNVAFGSTAQSTLTISNSGSATLTVSGIIYPSLFSGAWSGTIAAGGSTNITVTFAPPGGSTHLGTITYGGSIIVNSDANGGINTIAVSGAGADVTIVLLGNLDFGNVIAGTTTQGPLIISNSGFAPLDVSGITYPVGFSGAWSGMIDPGNYANVMVAFAPTTNGFYSGDITVQSDALDGINTIFVDGSGVSAPTKIISLSGSSLVFGNVPIGVTAQSTLTISNLGNTTLTVTGIAYPTGFSGAWSGAIAAGASTNITVTFAPIALMAYGGSITVSSDATSDNNTIAVSGVGVPVPTKVLSLSGNLAFGNVAIGLTAQSALIISNSGNATLTVAWISFPLGFNGEWNGTIAPGASTNVSVNFVPVAVMTYGGSVIVSSDATSGNNSIPISGTGMPLLRFRLQTNSPSGANGLVITWPLNVNGILQQKHFLTLSNWSPATYTTAVVEDQVEATVPLQEDQCYYRMICQ